MTAHRRPTIRFSDAPRGTCRWCGEDIVHDAGPKRGEPNRRRRWHPACVDAYNATDPREVRKRLRRRDRGICADCGLDTVALKRTLKGRGMTRALRSRGFVPRRSLWEVDHVVPLIDGGSHDLENLQTLCTPCHKAKTAREARARAAAAAVPVAATSGPPGTTDAPADGARYGASSGASAAATPTVARGAAADGSSARPPDGEARRKRARRVRRPEAPLADVLERASRVNARVESMLRALHPGS